jgi:predicted DCC family thiol-disulfide oxidoreductase YuxK
VNTEITNISDIKWLQGWLLYDGSCPSCRRFAAWLEPILTRRGFDLAPLQSAWVTECLGEAMSLREMKVLTLAGESLGGADALVFLARRIWWAWPLHLLAQIPGVMPIFRGAYRVCADRRHCHASNITHHA